MRRASGASAAPALVAHARVRDRLSAHQTIHADETQKARHHLIAARAVMAVEQDHFVGLGVVDLRGMAQADHLFCEIALALVAHAGLGHHERLGALLLQPGEDGGRRDVRVALRAAVVRGLGKDRRRDAAQLVFAQGRAAAQGVGVVAKA